MHKHRCEVHINQNTMDLHFHRRSCFSLSKGSHSCLPTASRACIMNKMKVIVSPRKAVMRPTVAAWIILDSRSVGGRQSGSESGETELLE